MIADSRYRKPKQAARIILLSLMVAGAGTYRVLGQQDSLNSLLRKFDQYRSQALGEKLFVHTDRTFYLTGETMWFNIYYRDASKHQPLDLSKVAYLEILDQDNKPVLQTKVGMKSGGGNGTFFLPTTLPSGNYLLRAYTQWMRNFSPDFYFQQRIIITNPFAKVGLKLIDARPHYDVQFFPEGGHLVNGLKSRIGFRVVDSHGEGIEFQGTILSERNDTVMKFQPLKFGLGHFDFTPTAQSYKAVIHDQKGNAGVYAFPAVQNDGYVIHVEDQNQNQISVMVTSRGQKPIVYLLAHTRQLAVSAQALFLEEGKAQFVIDRNKLGEGISHFTLFNHQMQPVCERLYFKKPDHKLGVEIQSDQDHYSQRQKINIDLFAHDQDGKSEELELSVSVCKADSLQNNNASDIVSYLWLTSELKGNIESPGYYFSDDIKSGEAVDNLMLTHGWSRFKWNEVTKNKKILFEFIPEYHGQIIRGRVLDILTGGPVKNITTYLSTPGKNIRLYSSHSDESGNVQYEMQDFTGVRRIVAQTNNLLDSTCRIELTNPFSEVFSATPPTEFDLSEQEKKPITARSFQMQIQNAFYDENPNRIDVPKVDSTAFYGIAHEQYWLEDYTRFPTMEEVMREYVPGVLVRRHKGKFNFMTVDLPNRSVFRSNPMVLLDGVPVFDIDKIMEFDPRKIKKLEVVTQQYFFGPLSFDGLVSYSTYKGDLADFQLSPQVLTAKYEGVQWTREFFVPHYESSTPQKTHIPDLRNLLFWTPNTKTNSRGKKKLDFYSSDVPGRYTVTVEGISSTGIPGISIHSFTVTDRGQF